jgi:hypothetical protein
VGMDGVYDNHCVCWRRWRNLKAAFPLAAI